MTDVENKQRFIACKQLLPFEPRSTQREFDLRVSQASVRSMISRRRFLKSLLWAGFGAAVVAGYGRWIEPRWLEKNVRRVPRRSSVGEKTKGESMRGGVELFRVLHLSDLHASPEVSLAQIEDAIVAGLAMKPDLVCVTGDLVTSLEAVPEGYAAVLKKLPAAVRTLASLGNHDAGLSRWSPQATADTRKVRGILAAAGIPLLVNQRERLEFKGRVIEVVGLGDLWSGECRPGEAFGVRGAAAVLPDYRIVMSHNPDSKIHLLGAPWDLMLSGHTHGGQLRVPLLGAPFAPVVDKKYIAGLYAWENRWLHVSKGVGNLMGVRLNCRPEVTLLEAEV